MELNAFSLGFADCLFQAVPEWRAFARVDRKNGAATGYLMVEVSPPPESRIAEALCVSTADDEVTVFVDAFHQHFSWPAREDDDPIAFIREILTEALIVVSWWNETEWLGSTVQLASQVVESHDKHDGATRIRVRSWNGTFNSDNSA
jgi:hypothetical protein